jgi:RNA polymerase sigma factor (sigma-70 family)
MKRYSQETKANAQDRDGRPSGSTIPEQSKRTPDFDETFVHAYPMARRAGQVRAAGAVAIGAVPEADAEDLEQEGLLACWQALHLFDPRRASLRTFIERVVAARMITLHRARTCRPRYQCIEDDEFKVSNAWAMEIEFRSDVQRVLSVLPDTDRQLALALIDHTPTEVTRLLGIARSTVYERLRHIRIAFADAGFRPEGGRG